VIERSTFIVMFIYIDSTNPNPPPPPLLHQAQPSLLPPPPPCLTASLSPLYHLPPSSPPLPTFLPPRSAASLAHPLLYASICTASRSGTATTSPLLRSIHGGIEVLRDDFPPYMRRRGRTCRPCFPTRHWLPPLVPEVAFPPVDPRGQAAGCPRPHPPDRGRHLWRLPQGRGHVAAVHPPLAPRHP
jgi:hypothetical protein